MIFYNNSSVAIHVECTYIRSYMCFTHTDLSLHLITHPTDTSAAAPFGAVFTCSARGNGYLKIIWQRLNNTLPKKSYRSVLVTSPFETTSILTIPNVTSEDVGTYYCVVWADIQMIQSRMANLFLAGKVIKKVFYCSSHVGHVILDPPLLPLIMTVSVVNLTINNFNLTLKCLPDKSSLNYTWIRKNDIFPSRAQGVNSSHLTIVDLKPEDSGDYQCIVSNNTGTISSNFTTVDIRGKGR